MSAALSNGKEEKDMRKIAVYGKGGIGKSTTVSNLSAALAARGLKVMQIGCDPKADSTRNLTGGVKIKTVLDVLRDNSERKKLVHSAGYGSTAERSAEVSVEESAAGNGSMGERKELSHSIISGSTADLSAVYNGDKYEATLQDIVTEGELGVLCVEAGGPVPGVGCAGRGIITAFEKLKELEAYEIYQPDIVLYDVLGDVVCGGFAMPIRGGYADEVCIVTSGEMMSLYAASNIAYAVKSFGGRGYASLKGLILNAKNIEKEEELVRDAAKEMEAPVLFKIDRNPLVQKAEDLGRTVVAAFPDSPLAAEYEKLSRILCP